MSPGPRAVEVRLSDAEFAELSRWVDGAVEARLAERPRIIRSYGLTPGIAEVDRATAGRARPLPRLLTARLLLVRLVAAFVLGFTLLVVLALASGVLVFGPRTGEGVVDRLPLTAAETPPMTVASES